MATVCDAPNAAKKARLERDAARQEERDTECANLANCIRERNDAQAQLEIACRDLTSANQELINLKEDRDAAHNRVEILQGQLLVANATIRTLTEEKASLQARVGGEVGPVLDIRCEDASACSSIDEDTDE